MKRIPSSFQIGSHRFTVKRVSEEEMLQKCGGEEAYGLFLPDTLTIYVVKSSRKLKHSIAIHTFWHEFSHALLWTLSHKDYNNEKTVDLMGHALKQFHDTAEFNTHGQ